MPINTWNTSWLNLNSQRRYPLAVDATGVDQTGSFTIPDDFLVELDLPIHSGISADSSRFFVHTVGAFASGYSVVVAYQPAEDGSDPVDVAAVLIPTTGFSRDKVYLLSGISEFTDTLGKVVVNSLDAISREPAGFWTFDFAAGRLDPDAIRPIVRGVSSLVVVDSTQRSVRLQGDIELVAGTNCRLDVSLDPSAAVVINFLNGEGTSASCECDGDVAQGVAITSIMGANADEFGNFDIAGSECIKVEEIEHGIKITDTCAEPCCGCAELERITEDLTRLTQERMTTQEFVSRLQVAVDTMNQIVLGARLGDQGCLTDI